MSFTIFSFVSAFIFSSFLLLTTHFLRENPRFIEKFGVKSVLIAYLLCLIRMMFTPEFSFTRTLKLPQVMNTFYEAAYVKRLYFMSQEFSFFSIFLGVWFVGALVLLILFITQYCISLKRIKKYSACRCLEAEYILSKVQSEYVRKIRTKVFLCPETSVPMGIGIINKQILLPYGKYPDSELYHIVKHEYTHFYNRDLTVKFVIMVFSCLFWWNPLVYLLLHDVSQMLEIKCDLTVTEHYDTRQKKAYLGTILSLLKEQDNLHHRRFLGTLGMMKADNNRPLIERFRIVIAPAKSTKRWIFPLIASLYFAAFVMSYSAVIQPVFGPEHNEIVSDDGTIKSPLDGYIVKAANGDYILYSPGEPPYKIKDETAEVFIALGIEIREDLVK